MAGKLQVTSNATLGFLGLNTQDNGVTLDSGFATKATNCVIDKNGRLSARKGWSLLSATNADLGSNPLESIFEFVTTSGNSTFLSGGNGKLFSGTTTLTRQYVYGPDSGGPVQLTTQPTYTTNRWQFAALQEGSGATAESYAVACQIGANALVYRRAGHTGSTYVFQRIGVDYGTKPSGVTTFDPDCCHAAFGRMWYARLSENKTTLFYSSLVDPVNLTSGSSGVFDLSSSIGNNDEIVAVSSHNGFLIVFCKRNIVVLADAKTPSTMYVYDVVPGVGCIARDSVQQTGNDIIFLSSSGVRALSRTVQEKSMPMRELSLNIRDDLVSYINGETSTLIRSVFFERDAFYLLVLPTLKQTFCFDTRKLLDTGASRVTIWDNILPKALCATTSRTLVFGMSGGYGLYNNYTDNGASYRMEYYTPNTDMGAPTTLKLLKKAKLVIIGSGTQDVIVKYGFDYSTSFSSRTFLKNLSGTAYEYGIAEYTNLPPSMLPPGSTGYVGTEYSGGAAIYELDLNLGGSGKVLQFGVEATIDGTPLNLQQMTVYMKTGKTI